MAITDCENVNTATAMLFDDKEFRLNPDEEIAKCEAIQVAIIKELQEIEKNTTSIVTKKIIFKKPVKQWLKSTLLNKKTRIARGL